MLTRLTITGADDSVDPQALVDLSQEFPFVEWAFLVSPSREGGPRYPRGGKLEDFCQQLSGSDIAVHLCGRSARSVYQGSPAPIREIVDLGVGRIQLNGCQYTPMLEDVLSSFLDPEFILQVQKEEDFHKALELDGCVRPSKTSALYDPSGGKGIEALQWPRPPKQLTGRVGFAGGIKPHTIKSVLQEIGPMDGPFWLDMESGVRTNDTFDLVLVRQALEAAAPFVVPGGFLSCSICGSFPFLEDDGARLPDDPETLLECGCGVSVWAESLDTARSKWNALMRPRPQATLGREELEAHGHSIGGVSDQRPYMTLPDGSRDVYGPQKVRHPSLDWLAGTAWSLGYEVKR